MCEMCTILCSILSLKGELILIVSIVHLVFFKCVFCMMILKVELWILAVIAYSEHRFVISEDLASGSGTRLDHSRVYV